MNSVGGKIIDTLFTANRDDLEKGRYNNDANLTTGCLSSFTSINTIRSANANKLVTPPLLLHPYSLQFILGQKHGQCGEITTSEQNTKIVSTLSIDFNFI